MSRQAEERAKDEVQKTMSRRESVVMARFSAADGGDDVRCLPHLAEHPGEAGEGGPVMGVEEGRRRVLGDDDIEAAVGGVARRRLHTHVGRHAGDHQRLYAHVSQ